MAAPATPASLSVTGTASNMIDITWANVASEDGFFLYKSLDDVSYTKEKVLATDVLAHEDFHVDPDTTYYYKISAFNGDGESALSAEQHDATLAASMKSVFFHNLGPFQYDQNSVYVADTGRFKKAIYGGGKSWLTYLHVDTDLRVDNVILFGPDAIANSWRMVLLSNELTFQIYDGGWVTQFVISPQVHIVDADGTLADITTKFNDLLSKLEALGLLETS